MTTIELAEYIKLVEAIKSLEEQKEQILTATVSATHELSGMPGGKGTVSDIVGNGATRIADIDVIIAEKKCEMERRRDIIIDYISSVSDPIIFAAMTHHYIGGLTWNATALKLNGNTADSLRMAVKRYVIEHP